MKGESIKREEQQESLKNNNKTKCYRTDVLQGTDEYLQLSLLVFKTQR